MSDKINQEPTEGMLVNLVKSSPKDIREGRGTQALNDVHLTYKQKIDAVHSKITALKNEMKNQLYKLVPNSTTQTNYDINPLEFIEKRVKLVEEYENTTIWFTALKADYKILFGKTYVEPESLLE